MWIVRIRKALSLAFLGVAATALLASGGASDPAHTHVVIGGTPAQRAHALAAHLSGELTGGYGGPTFGALEALAGGAGPAHVVSVGASDGGGPAVLNGGGGVDFTAATPVWRAALTASSPSRVGARVVITSRSVPASDPPPRPV